MKMTVKGGAAVDPDSGIFGSLSVFASLSLQSFLALWQPFMMFIIYRFISLFVV